MGDKKYYISLGRGGQGIWEIKNIIYHCAGAARVYGR